MTFVLPCNLNNIKKSESEEFDKLFGLINSVDSYLSQLVQIKIPNINLFFGIKTFSCLRRFHPIHLEVQHNVFPDHACNKMALLPHMTRVCCILITTKRHKYMRFYGSTCGISQQSNLTRVEIWQSFLQMRQINNRY